MNDPGNLPMDLRQLRYFVAVAEELHFGRAAGRLGISQPPLSEHVKSLETKLGVRLLERTKRHVSLTPSGRLLHAEATRLLAHSDRVRDVMTGAKAGAVGRVYLGCVPSGLYGAMPRIMDRARRLRLRLQLEVAEAHTADVLSAVTDGRLDAGLVWEDKVAQPLELRPLDQVSFRVALRVGHRLASQPRIALIDLAAEPLILPPRETTPHQFDRIIAGFRGAGISPTIGYQVRSIASQLGYVASGLGYALVPTYAERLRMPGVRLKLLRDRLESVPLSLVWNRRQVSSQLEAFITLATTALRRSGAARRG